MDSIISGLVDAGYYRARISTLSEFDKVIGGMAWALQVFSYDVNIDVFYTDTLDLGQKIALTERLIMLLIAIGCPYRVEPHQIVGLDYENLLPCIKWLIKRSEEVRREHEAFNRLLALRHYQRVTNVSSAYNRSTWCHIVPISSLRSANQPIKKPNQSGPSNLEETFNSSRANILVEGLNQRYIKNKIVSFIQLQSHFRAANISNVQANQNVRSSDKLESDDQIESSGDEQGQLDNISLEVEQRDKSEKQTVELSDADRILQKELNTELLATNQKILNLVKKLDAVPNDLEINQYQKRYIELHQQLLTKNKDIKKSFDLFNCLDSTRYYLLKEIKLLDSIATNFDLTTNSDSNKLSFMQQFQHIISKIKDIRKDIQIQRDTLREQCENLNIEYSNLIDG